jgi:hypothetical protein
MKSWKNFVEKIYKKGGLVCLEGNVLCAEGDLTVGKSVRNAGLITLNQRNIIR